MNELPLYIAHVSTGDLSGDLLIGAIDEFAVRKYCYTVWKDFKYFTILYIEQVPNGFVKSNTTEPIRLYMNLQDPKYDKIL